MEINLKNFDEMSKVIVKELVLENKKFSELVTKLQTAKEEVDTKSKFKKVLEKNK